MTADLIVPAADQRVAIGVASTLRVTLVDEYGEETAAEDDVTVTVTRSAGGTPVVTDAAATLDPATVSTYGRLLSITEVGQLDVLTAVWSVGGVQVATTLVEVVGRFYFTVAQLRASAQAFQTQAQTWTSAKLAHYRQLAEEEAEWICGRSFVPRFRQVTLEGSGENTLYLPDQDIREPIQGVSLDGAAYDQDQLDALHVYSDGRLVADTGDVWPWGQENVVTRYHYGWDAPPLQVADAALTRAKEMALAGGPNGTAIPSRATSMTVDSTTIELSRADAYNTGNDAVDAVYARYSRRSSGTSAAGDSGSGTAGLRPASRSIDFNPQAGGLFHGWPA